MTRKLTDSQKQELVGELQSSMLSIANEISYIEQSLRGTEFWSDYDRTIGSSMDIILETGRYIDRFVVTLPELIKVIQGSISGWNEELDEEE